MNNPKLSDFSEEQLTLVAKSMIYKKFECLDAIAAWKKYPSLESMFQKDIAETEQQIEDLETLITQFVRAVAIKQRDAKVYLN